MESIGGYASDEDSPGKETTNQGGCHNRDQPELDNYDNIQMDMSEDSNSNGTSRGSGGGRLREERGDHRKADTGRPSSDERRLDDRRSEGRALENRTRADGDGDDKKPARPSLRSETSSEKRRESTEGSARLERKRDGRRDETEHKHARRRSKSAEKDRRKEGGRRSPSSGRGRASPIARDKRSPRRDDKRRNGERKRSRSPRKGKSVTPPARRESKRRCGSPSKDDRRRGSSPLRDNKKWSGSPRREEKKRSGSPSRRDDRKRGSSPLRDDRKRSDSPRREERKRSGSPRREESKRSKRSPERFHRGGRLGGGRFEKKPSKISILERLGISVPGVTEFPLGVPGPTPAQRAQALAAAVAGPAPSPAPALPSYYNPGAINPVRYAEQINKRRLLWGNKTEPKPEAAVVPAVAGANNWEATTFRGDQEGKMTAKFKRLMGIKEAGEAAAESAGPGAGSAPPSGDELLRKQEEMFQSMEMQYEVARVATHTHRGLGLGFGAFQYPR